MAAASIPHVEATRSKAGAARDVLLLALMRLLQQLERPVTEPELRATAVVPPGGCDIGCIRQVAERLGFTAQVETVRARQLRRLPPPYLILGRDAGRAWLVRARMDGHLVVVEPVHGGATACTVEAVARLGQQALRLVPAAAEGAGLWRSSALRRVRGVLWQVALASVVINLLSLATPLFMMTVYNKVISHGALRTLDVLAIGMVTLVGFEFALRSLRGSIAAHAGARLDAAIGGDVVHHLLHLPYRTLETASTAPLLERVRQLDQLRSFLTGHLPLLIVDLAFVGLFVAALFVLTPTLAWVTVAAMPLFVLLSALAHRRQAALQRLHLKAAAAKSASLGETLSQALTVKSLALEPEMERRFDRHLVRSAWTGLQAGRAAQLTGSLAQALQHGTALMLVYLGARMIVAGELSIGALVAASILSARALAPMRQIAFAWTQLQQARDAMRRLDGLMVERTEAEGRRAGTELPIRGRLQLEKVRFRYAPDGKPAIDSVDLNIAPGTTLGIVGPTGSGKSTLLRLLVGLEQPQEGRVLLDGVDLKAVSPLAWRSHIGVVPQEVQLFSGTIAENIAIGAQNCSLERVVAAARFVGADAFIARLPDGYDTMLGERGTGLSMGQRQLLAVARAIVRNPHLLVLDEVTSALDAAAEAQLLTNIRRAGSGRTVIIVTHRPAALRICTRAVLMAEGRIALVGTPADILSRCKLEDGSLQAAG